MGDGAGGFAFWIAVGLINMAFWGAMTPVLKAWADRIRGSVAPPVMSSQIEAISARASALIGVK